MVDFNEEKQNARIHELRAKEEEDFAEIMAAKSGLPYIDLSKLAINTNALGIISETEARGASIACFRATGKVLDLVAISPESPAVKAIVDDLIGKGFSTTLYVASKASLDRAWEHYADIAASSRTNVGIVTISDEDIAKYLDSLTTLAEVGRVITEEEASVRSGKGISRLVEIMLAGALSLSSSDIHLEPSENSVRIRYRLD